MQDNEIQDKDTQSKGEEMKGEAYEIVACNLGRSEEEGDAIGQVRKCNTGQTKPRDIMKASNLPVWHSRNANGNGRRANGRRDKRTGGSEWETRSRGRRDKGDHPRARPDDQHKQRVSGDHYYHL
jgi:hypothetical protein